MRAFKAIIFDFDGTLFDTRAAIVHCFERAFAMAGRRPPQPDALVQTIGSGATLEDTFAALDGGLRGDPAAMQEHIKTYRMIYLDEGAALVKPFPGAARG